ncbi:MAG: polymer-forming cytoskeletal protein [Proteobacteria bacterium]|nr:polymer-forming cytoskeletal protein [Pseudomonadota bacterium]
MAADERSALPEGFAKRVVSIPGSGGTGSLGSPEAGKKLVVGKEICLSGEITACDTLVVEGQVEASLTDSRMFEITESGKFKGKVEIDVAEIRGRFEGEMTARTRLIIRRTGVVTGTIRYRVLEIEQGGEIAGTVEVLPEETDKTQPSKDARQADNSAH